MKKTNALLNKIQELSETFTAEIIKIIADSSIVELAQTDSADTETPTPMHKTASTSIKKARRGRPPKINTMLELRSEPALAPVPEPVPEPVSVVPAPEPVSLPPVPEPSPKPVYRKLSEIRGERVETNNTQELLRNRLVEFVSANPGSDATAAALHLNISKDVAQENLDMLVFKGSLVMISGQHGRCYRIPMLS